MTAWQQGKRGRERESGEMSCKHFVRHFFHSMSSCVFVQQRACLLASSFYCSRMTRIGMETDVEWVLEKLYVVRVCISSLHLPTNLHKPTHFALNFPWKWGDSYANKQLHMCFANRYCSKLCVLLLLLPATPSPASQVSTRWLWLKAHDQRHMVMNGKAKEENAQEDRKPSTILSHWHTSHLLLTASTHVNH